MKQKEKIAFKKITLQEIDIIYIRYEVTNLKSITDGAACCSRPRKRYWFHLRKPDTHHERNIEYVVVI